VDFRKGVDGLQKLCKQQIKQDPFSGAIFIFLNFSISTTFLPNRSN